MIPVGQCLGLGEISTPDDTIEAADAGATATRVVSRWRGKEPPPGYGTNFQGDSFAEDQLHRVRPEYEAMLRGQLTVAKSVRQVTVLAMDSDQLQGRMGGMDAWTKTRAARECRRQLIRLTRHYARTFGELVDYIEPLVEPQGPNATKSEVWGYQTESMLTSQAVAPHLRHLIGGTQAYQPNYAADIFCPDWATGDLAGRITLTCNFQDELVCAPDLFEDRLAKLLAARDRWGVPALVNQIWTDPPHDPDGRFLAAAIRRLAVEDIGSIVYPACTRFKDGNGGLRYLADPNDPHSAHIKYAKRWAAVTEAWREANA